MRRVDYILVISISIFFIIGIISVGIPLFETLDVKTITKDSDIYEEPFYLSFHWQTDDEIQVGNFIILDINVHDLPYNNTMVLEEISVRFYEEQLNYWSFTGDTKNDEILQQDTLILKPNWEDDVFTSEEIMLRFIVPTDISIEYCDFNLDDPCTEIPNIIRPAPYDLKNRIDTFRLIVSLSLITASLSAIVVWQTIRKK